MKTPDNIVVGKPILLEGESEGDVTWGELFHSMGVWPDEHTVFTDETHLPRILVSHGFFKSTGAVRKATPKKGQLPFVRDLREPEFTEMRIGHKIVWLIVGVVDGTET